MLFSFLKYLQPTHYFQCHTNNGDSIFPEIDSLPFAVINQLQQDENYHSKIAQDYDLSWQAVQRGYIGKTPKFQKIVELPIYDNYVFIRKYFHSAWVLYVLFLRLLSFKNPIKEFKGWYGTRHLKKTKLIVQGISYLEWKDFKSELISDNPKVSVVIPTLNRYDYLRDVLADFETQDYKNFEIIVVDQSDNFNENFYSNFNLDINLIRQEEKALWLARNTAIAHAKGHYIALSEDDVRISKDWISLHLKCLDFFKAKVSAGVFYPKGKHIPKERSFFSAAFQFATGNAMLHRDVFKSVGLFDRQFEKQRMGDGEFGMRVYLNNIKSVSNPYASCVDVKAGTGGLREMGSWDAFRPSNLFAPRPIPSVLYYFRRYFGDKAARLALLRTIPLSVFPYQFKKNKPLLLLGALITIIISPIVYIQVYRSWRLASKKIKEGPLIKKLD